MIEDAPEVFRSTAATSLAVSRAVSAGRARRIARGLFTRNTTEPLESVVLRNWAQIAAFYSPGAVVVDRSAFTARPSEDGSLMLDGGPGMKAPRTYKLPGLTLRARPGPGPLLGDMPHLGDLFFSSRPRAWLDNMTRSRARGGQLSRTLGRGELESELNRVVARQGWAAINELRDAAAALAPELNKPVEAQELDDLIGALQGTRDGVLMTRAGRSAAAGAAFDSARIALFGVLHSALLLESLPRRVEQPNSQPTLSFIEAYFSNWIEGTEFELDEAEEIVFTRIIPEGRVEDAHDILGTFDVVNDASLRGLLPANADDFISLLQRQHALILGRRPQTRPGAFKDRENRAGATTFVHPDLVIGTLREGFRFVDSLSEGLPRAIFLMFLIAEVHPFTDGNGRVGRVFMNAALTAAGLQRIVVPLSFRDNYLDALRALTRNANATPLIRVLDFAQQYAATIPWHDLDTAVSALDASNAFVRPDVAEQSGRRLRIPGRVDAISADVSVLTGQESEREWVRDHVDDLQAIWSRFSDNAEWPDGRRLARELFAAGRSFDLESFASALPPRLGRLDRSSGELSLTLRAVRGLAAAKPVLAALPDLARAAVQRYGDPEAEPVISSSEFSSLLGLSDLQARQLSALLLSSSWLLPAYGNDSEGRQQFQIDPSGVLRARNVRDVDGYFQAENQRG